METKGTKEPRGTKETKGTNQRGLLPGTVDLVILQTLTGGPLHGFAVSRSVGARSEGVLELQDAALYQALHRMEKSGWIEAEWGISEKGKRAKYYRLTAAGERQLQRETGFWRDYARAVFAILEPGLGPTPEKG
ncbi:MAG TPA: PadR family transcriptional regulator [Longimicrobiales bacterium]|nr:PadR family transcriptional regulator [Longimicrobiales bacterium]